MNGERPRIIAVEGFDGSGKSTIAKWIADNMGYEYHKSPTGIFAQVRNEFDKAETSLHDRLPFYIGDCVRVSMMLQSNLNNFVLDRYYYSTLAYHEAKYPGSIKELVGICRQLAQPDLVILVKAPFETLVKRIADRNENSLNDALFQNEKLVSEIYFNYQKFINVPIIEINNSGSFEEVTNKLKSIL